jgi:hypothetical protein
MDWLKDVNNKLSSTRDQKFRSIKESILVRNNNLDAINKAKWSSKGVYILSSPGSDLLNFYDEKWQEYIDDLGVGKIYSKNNGRNQIGLVPPSIVYKMRFIISRDRKTFKNECWELLSPYVNKETAHTAYHNETASRMYQWLTEAKSKQYKFNLLEQVYDFLDDHLSIKVHRGELSPHRKDNPTNSTVWWRKEAAGWSIRFIKNED